MRRNVLHAVAVTALLVTAGCTGLSTGGDGTPDAAQLQDDAAAAMADAETYRMEMRMNVSAGGQSMTMTQDAVFDHDTERARVDATSAGRSTTTYIDGTTAYVNAGGVWRTQDLSEVEPWNDSSGIRQQRSVLQSANVTVNGSATVDGVETTVLSVEPETEELQSLVTQRTGSLDAVEVEDATYRMYVANDTHRLRQVEMNLEMTVGGQSAVADATTTVSEYGEPVNVSVPEAATEREQAALAPVAA
ncbi:DUF6612 family protein [Halobacterium sp. R2-5]|uniref:DUF6612 family protein n=1 Tax=Halobacterium sp. R2-5 TaxID=2715751 RepID=UPI001422AB53|nr:DUF6612 family protein [Halobacterium sp. R2-5]NIC00455.1 hypothetical protein [Halobacterium sp. R2-5]